LVYALGFDIGGANTKAALIQTENSVMQIINVAVEYFPVWKEPQKLSNILKGLKQKLNAAPDVVGVTLTAELSDAYQTKREGVHHILRCVKEAFPNAPIYVLNSDAQLFSIAEANHSPISVAAANWAATGWLIAQYQKDSVVVDVGSTSTSIIPVINGKVAAKGKTDLEKLICGELVYTGCLRTNVAAIVQSIPVWGGVATVASELFALSGDVHLFLGHIAETQYTSETADGRGKTIPEAMARLARVVCADIEMLSTKEIHEIVEYVYYQQIKQITQGLTRVYEYTRTHASGRIPVVVTGLGKDFLARKAAESIGADSIIDLATLLPKEAVMATPAVGISIMSAVKHTGEALHGYGSR
jgi:probable H4MPT-linked C1 transfer pathway protein